MNKKILIFLLNIFICISVFADSKIEMKADLDREEIAEDESVSLQISLESNENINAQSPEITAPDFEIINDYTSTQMSQTYDSNGLQTVVTKQFTFVLRPKKIGKLKISNIQIQAAGKKFTTGDRIINVTAGGNATSPPQNYGGAGSGLRGAVKESKSASVFIRTEVNKEKVYKGESVIISYYFYARANGFTVAGEKYPEMSGFLKEEVDMPILTGRLEAQVVVLDGIPYKKVLLARYNASPLKAGKLKIDPLMVKAQYYSQTRGRNDDEADDIFAQFFNRMTPQVAQLKGDVITLEVLDTPSAPSDFTGGLGEFSVSTLIDKSSVNVNDPFTITLKVEGKGNFSQIKAPELNLNSAENKSLQLFESKNQVHGGKAGTQGEKIFEYLVVPRQAGSYVIPGFKFSVFNIKSGKYETLSTQPIQVKVSGTSEGSESFAPLPPNKSTSELNEIPVENSKINLLENIQSKKKLLSKSGIYFLLTLTLFLILILIYFIYYRFKKVSNHSDQFKTLQLRQQELAKKIKQINWSHLKHEELVLTVSEFSEYFMQWCGTHFGEDCKSLPRNELKNLMISNSKMKEETWIEIENVLNSFERIQFGGNQIVKSDEEQALINHSVKNQCEKLINILN